MCCAAGYSGHLASCQVRHQRRLLLVCAVAGAQLTTLVGAKCPDASVSGRDRVKGAHYNVSHRLQRHFLMRVERPGRAELCQDSLTLGFSTSDSAADLQMGLESD